MLFISRFFSRSFFFFVGEQSRTISNLSIVLFWDRVSSCQISVHVILFLIFINVYRICLFFLLLFGVRSRSFGVTAEIENSYILRFKSIGCGLIEETESLHHAKIWMSGQPISPSGVCRTKPCDGE